MFRSIFSLFAILIASLATITLNAEPTRTSMNGLRSHWLANGNQDRNELLRKWMSNQIDPTSPESRSISLPFEKLHTDSQFKGVWNSFSQ
jgi:inhibitor of KinA sporulation pathway (predicted exonuclease)